MRASVSNEGGTFVPMTAAKSCVEIPNAKRNVAANLKAMIAILDATIIAKVSEFASVKFNRDCFFRVIFLVSWFNSPIADELEF